MSVSGTILVRDGLLVDPAQGWREERGNIYIADGKICEPFEDPEIIIDACGRPVLAGGLDPFCHVASPGRALASLIHDIPSSHDLGECYARMGYVHVHQPFMTLLTAGAVRRSLDRIPYVDASASVVLDLRDMGVSIRGNNYSEFNGLARALVDITGALGLCLPFPYLRHTQRHYLHKNISAKKLYEFVGHVGDRGIVPITLWGTPGVLEKDTPGSSLFHLSCLDQVLDSREALARVVSFLDSGGSGDLALAAGGMRPAVAVDTRVSAESISLDVGIGAPLRYSVESITLENTALLYGWLLMAGWHDHWHLSLCSSQGMGTPTDLAGMISWLLFRHLRPREVDTMLQGRVFDLYDIARLTRLEPARALGLEDMGHLSVGASANVVLYDATGGRLCDASPEILSQCWCLIKDGVVVRYEGRFTGAAPPQRIRDRTGPCDTQTCIQSDLLRNPSMRWETLYDCRSLSAKAHESTLGV